MPQERIPVEVCRRSAVVVAVGFEELHNLIELTLKNISAIGELYCYDTAPRIGAKLNLHPHAGTKKGASFIVDRRGNILGVSSI